jgi:hypothetical protein
MGTIQLCHVFKKLHVKVVDPTTMGELKKEVVITLILVEQEFPSFFDVMTHLMIHIVEGLELCNLIHT